MTGSEDSFVRLENARLEEQRQVMERIEGNQECPFCPENLHRYHKEPILRQGEFWTLTRNQWPYEHTDVHLLAIAAHHAEHLHDLPSGSFEELGQHFIWAEQEFRVAAGGLAMRFGDTRYNGATVAHLHAHLIVPSADKPEDFKVRFKIS